METFLLLSLPLLTFWIGFMLFPKLIKYLHKIEQVDTPDIRKKHGKITATSGGILFILIGLVLLFINYDSFIFLTILFCGAIMGVIGFWDDRKDVSARLKFGFQLILSTPIIFLTGPFPITSIIGVNVNETFDYGFTIIGFIGFVNAFNLMDGINGLAGIIAIYSFTILGLFGITTGNSSLTISALSLAGIMAAFLHFNVNKDVIFMGDTGSLFIGFVLGGLILFATNMDSTSNLYPPFVSLMLLPLLDSIRVYLQRIMGKKSPFAADRTHFHHILKNIGFTNTHILIIAILIIFIFQIEVEVLNSFHFKSATIFILQFITYNLIMITFGWLEKRRFTQLKNRIEQSENEIKSIRYNQAA